MIDKKDIFGSALILDEMGLRLDGAEKSTGKLVNFLTDQRLAIETEVLNRLYGEQQESFGEFDYFIDSVVKQLKEVFIKIEESTKQNENEKNLIKKFFNSRKETSLILKNIKKYGFDWLPERFVLTGKFIFATSLIALSFDPLRTIFVSSYLSMVDKDMLPLAVATYLATITAISLQEIKYLKNNSPFVMNPYVSILALKSQPELASLFIRLSRLMFDGSIWISAHFASKYLLSSSEEIVPPLLFLWFFGCYMN